MINQEILDFIDNKTAKRLKSLGGAYLNNPCESLRESLRYYNSINSLLTEYLDQINEINYLRKKVKAFEESAYKGQ